MKTKITVLLHGGLGNMLFQIAAAYAYSLEYAYEFELYDNLYIPCHHPSFDSYKDNIFSNIKISSINDQFYKYNESSFCYDKIPKFENNLVLYGYFQSEKYFLKYKEQIHKIFDFDSDLIEKYSNELKQKTCSIHVRRGDYLNLQHCYLVQDLEYYKKAMALFDKHTLFFIFSNDIEWCKNIFTYENTGFENFIFIEGNKNQDDLLLMSKCQNNIIANSTFSWWGAWLNQNINKKIIAPKNWFSENYAKEICGNKYETYKNDLIPNTWIQI
jgi:hypothetical protein